MVKHTQEICCLSVFVHFVGLALKVLSEAVNEPKLKKLKSKDLFQFYHLSQKRMNSLLKSL